MDSREVDQPAKDSTIQSSDKLKTDEVKEITSPPDFRNILKKFEETKDIVKVEKVPSSTDILPHSVGSSKVGQLGTSDEKNIEKLEETKDTFQVGKVPSAIDILSHSAGFSKVGQLGTSDENNIEKFEETKNIVEVEKVPSATDISPHSVGSSKVGQLGTSDEKSIGFSIDTRAGVQEGNLIIFDNKPVSGKYNFKDDKIDAKHQELTDKGAEDSTEENVKEQVTLTSKAVLKDAGSDSYTVKESDVIQSTSEPFATDTVIFSREPRYKIMLVGKNVSQHPLSVTEDDKATEELIGQATEMESSLIPGIEDIQKKVANEPREPRYKIMLVGKNVSQRPLSLTEDKATEELIGQVTEMESSLIPGIEDIQKKVANVIAAAGVTNPSQIPVEFAKQITEMESTTPGTEGVQEKGNVTTAACVSGPSQQPRKKKYSLQELEQSFIAALNMPDESAPNLAKLAVSKSLPAIKISHSSDFENEDDASELAEAIKDDKQAEILPETEISDASEDVNLKSNTEANVADRSYEGESSIGQSMSLEFDEQGCIQRNMAAVTEAPTKERQKPFFYISSSELPPELRYRVTAVSGSSNASPDQNCRVSQSCLCSKDLHGFIFLIGSSVAILAFAVAALAHQGNIPSHYEIIGFTVSIISGIFGALSFVCYTILTCYSACTVNRYQRLTDAESALPFNRAGQYENVIEESWSSEKERAWRRQNAMSSTRISEVSVRSVSERQALIVKTQRIKKDVTELLDTYANIVSELESTESIEMQALSNEDEKKSENLQESPSTE